MKLSIKRSQEEKEVGMISKSIEVTFKVFFKLDVSEKELSLIKKYKIHQSIVSQFDYSDSMREKFNDLLNLDLVQLMNGHAYIDKDGAGRLSIIEDVLKDKCTGFSSNIKGQSNYGGEEEIEL